MTGVQTCALPISVNKGGRFCIPSKTFEYLAFGRHIIALTHRGTELTRTLAEAGNVTLVEHGDTVRLVQALEACYESWLAGKLDQPRNQQVVGRYRRDRLDADYARILNECVCSTPDVNLVPTAGTVWEAA